MTTLTTKVVSKTLTSTPDRVSAESVVRGPQIFPAFNPPAKIGVLYTKTWQAPVVHGVTDIWAQRIAGYWDRIEKKYGLIMSDHRNAYDDATGTITTFATVLAVIPGERYSLAEVQ
jgi:hypothetical protein